MQGGEHGEVGGGAGRAGVGREVEQHHRHPLVPACGPAQCDLGGHAGGQHRGAFGVADHVLAGRSLAVAGAPAVSGRAHAAVELGQGDHHGGFDGKQAAGVAFPLLDRLELERVGGDVGHVQLGEQVLGGAAVIVGGAADEGEAGERHDRVHGGGAIPHEERLDRRTGIEAAGEGGDDVQALRLKRRDHAVIMAGVAADRVGAQHDHADRALGARRGKVAQALGDVAGNARVIQAEFRVFDGGCDAQGGGGLAVAGGVAVHQHADHVDQVLFGPGEPVLQGQEIRPHILRGAGDETHQLRQPAQHLHLRLPGGGAALALPATQAFQQGHDAGRLGGHVEAAEPRQPGDLGCGHAAEHGVAGVAPGGEGGLHGADMVLQEQHRRDHDVRPGDGLVAAAQQVGIGGPFVGRVDLQRQAGQLPAQFGFGPGGGAGQVAVHRHEHDPDRRNLSGHSGPWRHTASPP